MSFVLVLFYLSDYCSIQQLENEFLFFPTQTIRNVMRRHHNRYAPSRRALKSQITYNPLNRLVSFIKYKILAIQRSEKPMPPLYDEEFFRELEFVKNEEGSIHLLFQEHLHVQTV
jgi:hypothetical protein